MTLKDFNRLDEQEQIQVVWKATLLAEFIEKPYRYVLYQMVEIYIELRYNLESNALIGISAFDDPAELGPYQEQFRSLQVNGKPKCSITELRDQSIKLLPAETINVIMSSTEDQLIFLSYSLGVQLRNNLNMWHMIVTDYVGNEIHPDDATLRVIREIWMLDK